MMEKVPNGLAALEFLSHRIRPLGHTGALVMEGARFGTFARLYVFNDSEDRRSSLIEDDSENAERATAQLSACNIMLINSRPTTSAATSCDGLPEDWVRLASCDRGCDHRYSSLPQKP